MGAAKAFTIKPLLFFFSQTLTSSCSYLSTLHPSHPPLKTTKITASHPTTPHPTPISTSYSPLSKVHATPSPFSLLHQKRIWLRKRIARATPIISLQCRHQNYVTRTGNASSICTDTPSMNYNNQSEHDVVWRSQWDNDDSGFSAHVSSHWWNEVTQLMTTQDRHHYKLWRHCSWLPSDVTRFMYQRAHT